METINKLLKKQAPKVSRKAAAAAAEAAGEGAARAAPVFVRWVSNKNGIQVGVPSEILDGPTGQVFQKGDSDAQPRKMVQEVA
jgi:Ino eighty subunit 2